MHFLMLVFFFFNRFPPCISAIFTYGSKQTNKHVINNLIPPANRPTTPTQPTSYNRPQPPPLPPMPPILPILIPIMLPIILPEMLPMSIPSLIPVMLPIGRPTMIPMTLPIWLPPMLPMVLPMMLPMILPKMLPILILTLLPILMSQMLPILIPIVLPTKIPKMLPVIPSQVLPTLIPMILPIMIPMILSKMLPMMLPIMLPIMLLVLVMRQAIDTGKSSDVHFLQVLGFEDDDGEFTGRGHVTQREADVAQLIFLQSKQQQQTQTKSLITGPLHSVQLISKNQTQTNQSISNNNKFDCNSTTRYYLVIIINFSNRNESMNQRMRIRK